MANTILMKNRASDATKPADDNLKQGELAVNSFDGSIYMGTKLAVSGTAGSAATASTWVAGNIKDEDTMSSDSATALATQQSIKAYVDSVPLGDITAIVAGTGMTGSNLSGPIPTLNVIGGTGIAANADDVALSHLGIEALSDPDADRIMFWDDSATAMKFLTAGSGLSISGTTITASGEQLTTEQVQDIVGGMVTGNTETNIAVTYEDGDGTLDFVSTDTGVRTVTAGGNTLASGETLAFTAGTNMTITESAGAVTLAAPVRAVTAGGNSLAAGETLAFTAGSNISIAESAGAVTITGTDTQPLTTEQVQDIVGGMVTGNTETNIAVTYEDGDGTLDFVATDNNTTYSAGTDLDLSGTTFSLEPALDSVTSLLNSSLTDIGTAADQEYIKFDTSNEINMMINDTERLSVTAAGADVTGALTVSGALTVTGDTTVVNILAGAVSNTIQFEGSADDGYETTVGVINPTADRAINFPDAAGTVSLTDTNTTYSAGALLDLSGTTFNVDLTEAGEAAMTVADDYVLFLDGGATGTQSKEKWADIAALIAGTNITASNGVLSAADTQPLTTEQVQDIVGGMVTGNTETNIAVTYEDGDGTLDFVSTDTGVRTVTAGGNTLASGETLAFTAGTNMTITESAGAVTLTAPVRTVTAGGNTLAAGETLAFTAGSNMTIAESGGAVTLTAANDNTTYSAGNGISLSSTTFSVAGNTGLDQDSDGLSIDSTVCTLTGTQTLTNKTIDAGAYST